MNRIAHDAPPRVDQAQRLVSSPPPKRPAARLASPRRRIVRPAIGAAAIVLFSGVLFYSAGHLGEIGSAIMVGALAASGIAWLMVAAIRRSFRDWVEPIQDLTSDTNRMAGGAWHFQARIPDPRELRDLAKSVNHLGAEAHKQLVDLRQQRRDLQMLVDTLPDPVVATDASQHIALANTAAARLLGRTPFQLLGKPIATIIADPAIRGLYEQVIHRGGSDRDNDGDYAHREIHLVRDNRPMTFHAAALVMETGGVLLILRDITALAGAMQMKTDFVANASHELRTPIAAIKIAFETLSEVYTDDPSQTERCLAVIDGHLLRLEALLRDLLDLSRVETAGIDPVMTEVESAELLRTLDAGLRPVAQRKGLELVLDDRQMANQTFRSDQRLLDLVLKNLVENAIKFTPPGGKVTVAISRVRDAVGVAVSDTGIGIPPEHVERVFERFYQVDPARSGSAGRGTGLGLAIVKHAVARLGGSVHLTSQTGKGTTVTCSLPQPGR